MARDCLILFARQPALGRAKTRLAREIGALAAQRIAIALLDMMIRRLARDRRWRTLLCVTPDRARWRGWRGLPRIAQGRGMLGQRMARALRSQAKPQALLVGSDIPELSAADIADAFRRLRSARFLFGPAEDGGYWAIGWRRGAWPFRALRDVRWSSEHALADSLRTLPAGSAVARTRRLSDLDDGAALVAWRKSKRRPR